MNIFWSQIILVGKNEIKLKIFFQKKNQQTKYYLMLSTFVSQILGLLDVCNSSTIKLNNFYFQLTSHKDLVEWAVLRGNDFTAEYIREIQKHIGFSPGCSYEKTCSELITKHKSIGRIPAIKPFKVSGMTSTQQSIFK